MSGTETLQTHTKLYPKILHFFFGDKRYKVLDWIQLALKDVSC